MIDHGGDPAGNHDMSTTRQHPNNSADLATIATASVSGPANMH